MWLKAPPEPHPSNNILYKDKTNTTGRALHLAVISGSFHVLGEEGLTAPLCHCTMSNITHHVHNNAHTTHGLYYYHNAFGPGTL